MTDPIRTLIIDDSPSVCRVLTTYLKEQGDIDVVESVNEGGLALDRVMALNPDVLLLDVDMPGLNGLEVLERIMSECPTPVVLISGVNRNAAATSLEAFKLGAVDFIFKYAPGTKNDPASLRKEVVSKVRSAAAVKVVRLLRSHTANITPSEQFSASQTKETSQSRPAPAGLPESILVVGASTGGPISLRAFLSAFSLNLPTAVLIVQHFPAGFTKVLAAQLNRHVPFDVRVARQGDSLGIGKVLIAPCDYHLLLGSTSKVVLSQSPEVHGHRPSISRTMQSAVEWFGSKTVGVLLSGMGDDGRTGLEAIQSSGGRTYAQDVSSCVAGGMPRRAIEAGYVDFVATPELLAQRIAAEHAHTIPERVM